MRARHLGLTPFLLLATLLVIPVPRVAAQSPPAAVTPAPSTDLDALMARVLANRDQTWRSLQEYLLAERETFKLVGPDGAPMFGLQKEFMWVAREGRAVRSPVRVNGVAIGEETRRREEAEWQADEDRRAERASEKAQSETATTAEVEQAMRRGEPRFISEVQFLRFRFEPGNYYFVGRETLAGREVLRIEYYPRRLFADDSRGTARRARTRERRRRPPAAARARGGPRRGRPHRARDQQGVARHPVGGRVGLADRPLHVRQRRLQLPPGAIPRPRRHRDGDDDAWGSRSRASGCPSRSRSRAH